jgi:hypothetical protein
VEAAGFEPARGLFCSPHLNKYPSQLSFFTDFDYMLSQTVGVCQFRHTSILMSSHQPVISVIAENVLQYFRIYRAAATLRTNIRRDTAHALWPALIAPDREHMVFKY